MAYCDYTVLILLFFFFNDTATTEIYTLSLHDALPIRSRPRCCSRSGSGAPSRCSTRSEEHTSELQSPCNLVCRLLLEKKKNFIMPQNTTTTFSDDTKTRWESLPH